MLKDKVFKLEEYQKKVMCQMELGNYALENNEATIEDFITISRKAKGIDPWHGLWMAMQFFSPNANRAIAFDCLGRVKAKINYDGEMFEECWHTLRRYLAGELDEAALQKAHEDIRMRWQLEKNKYSKDEQLLIKSAIAALAPEPEKSCPLILLNLRSMVGDHYLDLVVIRTLREHP